MLERSISAYCTQFEAFRLPTYSVSSRFAAQSQLSKSQPQTICLKGLQPKSNKLISHYEGFRVTCKFRHQSLLDLIRTYLFLCLVNCLSYLLQYKFPLGNLRLLPIRIKVIFRITQVPTSLLRSVPTYYVPSPKLYLLALYDNWQCSNLFLL